MPQGNKISIYSSKFPTQPSFRAVTILAYSLGKPVPASSIHRVLLLQPCTAAYRCTCQVRREVQAPLITATEAGITTAPGCATPRSGHSAAVGLPMLPKPSCNSITGMKKWDETVNPRRKANCSLPPDTSILTWNIKPTYFVQLHTTLSRGF